MTLTLRNRQGFALEATLIFLVLLTALIGAAVAATVLVQRTSGVDYRGSRVQYAAEAGAEHVMSQLAAYVQDGVVEDDELDALTAPDIYGFAFDAPQAERVGAPVPRVITDPPFAGLYGLNQQIDVRTTARDPQNNRSTAIVSVNAQAIPLFQFGVFYAGDLEIHNGPRMDFAGWVHANGNIYMSSDNLYFQDNITTPDSVIWRRKATSERRSGVFIDNEGGTAVALDFDSRSLAGSAFVSRSNDRFDGRLMSGASGVTPLNLPLPAGSPPWTMVEERMPGDSPAIQAVKFAWKADLHIIAHVDRLGAAPASFCNFAGGGALQIDGPVPDAATCDAIFDGLPNHFHDGREQIGVDLLDVNVQALTNWANGNGVEIVYVTFVGDDPAVSDRDYPALRLRNGAQLLAPLSVATDRPLYVRGNYNSNGWQPAALLADAVTFLSGNWTDPPNTPPYTGTEWDPAWDPDVSNPGYAAPNATATTVFAAIAAGHSSTPCDVNRSAPACNPADSAPPPLTPAISLPNYGGGLENFPRFLENWGGGVTFTYRGSLVSLYTSRFANRRRWGWRGYYNPPTRDWQFDLRFRDPTQLPPGTPSVGSVVQVAFRPVY